MKAVWGGSKTLAEQTSLSGSPASTNSWPQCTATLELPWTVSSSTTWPGVQFQSSVREGRLRNSRREHEPAEDPTSLPVAGRGRATAEAGDETDGSLGADSRPDPEARSHHRRCVGPGRRSPDWHGCRRLVGRGDGRLRGACCWNCRHRYNNGRGPNAGPGLAAEHATLAPHRGRPFVLQQAFLH